MTLLLIAMLRGTGRVVVDTPHNTFPREGWRERRPGHLIERTSSVRTVHARADLETLADPDRAVVIPHGEYATLADGGKEVGRDLARSNLGIVPEAPVTLVFGQLRKDKGIIDVLMAALELPDLVVLMAGEDVEGYGRSPVDRRRELARSGHRQGGLPVDG